MHALLKLGLGGLAFWGLKEVYVTKAYAGKGGIRFYSPISPLIKRGTDIQGSGDFGALRLGHLHEGEDYKATTGQNVKSPIDGTFVRLANPYPNDSRFGGALLKTISGVYEIKIYYFKPDNSLIGKTIKRGDIIGTVQDITLKYKGITNHIHIEVRENGKVVNPNDFF